MIKHEFIIGCVNKGIDYRTLNLTSREKVLYKCEKCGKIDDRQFRSLTNKDEYICTECINHEILSRKEVKEKLSKIHKGHKYNAKPFNFHLERIENFGYISLTTEEEYIKTGKISIKCPKDDYIFDYRGKRTACKRCAIEKSKKNPQTIGNFNYYKARVKFYTEISYKKYFYEINPEIITRNSERPLDHMYSVKMGFENNIPPYIIGSMVNLYMGLTKSANSQKSFYSTHDIEELFEKFFNFFRKEGGNIF